MIKALGRFLGGSVGALLIAGAVHAQPQVTIGPMAPSGAPGQQVGFDITYSGPTDTNGISFNILYPADVAAEFTPVFRSGSTTKIQCATASDLDPGITTSGVVLASGKIAFTVIGLSLDTGPIAFGRTGVVGTCQFMIANTASGTVPLACDPTSGQTTASDVNGNNLPATCVDGTLTVSAPAVTLSAAISPTDTSITVSDASSINVGDTLKIDDEQMIVTGKSGNTLTVTRAANGTTGVAHAAETPVTILAAPPTPTSTPVTPATATPTPTSVASPTVTVAPSVTASATRTVPPIGASPTPGCPTCQNDDDGCQIGAAGHSSAWLLLIPAIGLLVVRRRRR
jgi:MYXO-CTERM domain-containing protein